MFNAVRMTSGFVLLTGSLIALSGCGSRESTTTGSASNDASQRTASPAVMSVREAEKGAAEADSAPRSERMEFAVAPADEIAGHGRDADVVTAPETAEPRPAKRLETSPPARQIQSGTLTAGSLDDHADFSSYRDYVSQTLQSYPQDQSPAFSIGQRIPIRVVSESGEGLADARIRIAPTDAASADQPDSSARSAVELVTGGDGGAVFLTGYHGLRRSTNGEFRVTVQMPADGGEVTAVMSQDQSPWTVTLPQGVARQRGRLDVALVIDTTGSMGDELEYLKVEFRSIVSEIRQQFPDVQQRFALVAYRDEGDQYVTRTFDFTDSIDRFQGQLAAQSAGGGGDYPEAVHVALQQATQLSWSGDGTARVLFFMADAPPHDAFVNDSLSSVRELAGRGVTMFPVAASGTSDKAEFLMRAAAFLTRGQYLFLTDHSGVGNAHAAPHAPSYNVERLDRLMIRMIAGELLGRKLLPGDVIATERPGDNRSAQPGAPVENQQQSDPPAVPSAEQSSPQPEAERSIMLNWGGLLRSPVVRGIAALLAICGILYLDRYWSAPSTAA